MLCPRCRTQPSRYEPQYRGRSPLCVECEAAAKLLKEQQHRSWKRGERLPAPTLPREVHARWGESDLSPAEIERRFQLALTRIKQRSLGR